MASLTKGFLVETTVVKYVRSARLTAMGPRGSLVARCRPSRSIQPTPAVNVLPLPGRNPAKYLVISSVSPAITVGEAAIAESDASCPAKYVSKTVAARIARVRRSSAASRFASSYWRQTSPSASAVRMTSPTSAPAMSRPRSVRTFRVRASSKEAPGLVSLVVAIA